MKCSLESISFILLSFILSLLSCYRTEVPDPYIPPIINPDTNIVWQTSRSDSQQFFSIKPIIANKSVYFSLHDVEEVNSKEKIVSFNKLTGTREWSWGEPKRVYTDHSTLDSKAMYLACQDWYNTYIIDCKTGKTIWYDYTFGKEPRGNIVGDYFYTGLRSYTDDTMYLIRSPLKFLKWDTLFSVSLLENNQNFRPGLDQPKLWMNPNGDSILIVPDRMVRKGGSAYRFDIYAFNINKRRMEWKLDHFTPNGYANADPLLIKDNLCFVVGEDINCIDLLSGKQKWSVDLNSYVGNAKIIVEENKVIAKMHNTDLVALDMNTGSTIWINKNAGDDPLYCSLAYSSGFIYSNVGRGSKVIIARFNINTGIEDWTYESSNGKYFNDGTIFDMSPITVDPETGLIYACDRFNVMCIRPPK